MAGQAVGGIFPAIVDIFFIFVDVEPKDIGFACFSIATLVLIASFLGFSWMRGTRFFKYYAEERSPMMPVVNHDDEPREEESSLWQIIMHSWKYCLSIYLVLTSTLAVFPAVTVLIKSEFNPSHTPFTDKIIYLL